MKRRLELNTAGAWKLIVTFDESQLEDVKRATQILATVESRGKWRIASDDQPPRALMYCLPERRAWEEA